MSSRQENIFLVPCDPGNFDRTVRSTVDLSDVDDIPDELSETDEVRFWGARVGKRNRSYFEKMDADSLLLFYQDGRYIGTGWVGTTFEDEAKWASTTFWKNAPSQLIYTIDDFEEISVPKSVVNGVFEYDEDYYPQGLTRVSNDRFEKLPASIKLALERYDQN